MVSGPSKILFAIGIALLMGCPSAQAASVTELLSSMLSTLKSIEKLMKYESSVVPEILPRMLDAAHDSNTRRANSDLLKKLQDKYGLHLNSKAEHTKVPEDDSVRRSLGLADSDNDDEDNDDTTAKPIDIQLPSRRELDAEKRSNKHSSAEDESEEEEDNEKSEEDNKGKKHGSAKNYRNGSRNDDSDDEDNTDESRGGKAAARRTLSSPADSEEMELQSDES